MEPGHEDREYATIVPEEHGVDVASMEPGHEDREYPNTQTETTVSTKPQWSPVMKTGNTLDGGDDRVPHALASMEPGHEDREYQLLNKQPTPPGRASMEPGHEDREYLAADAEE